MTKSAKGTVEQPGRNVAQKRGLNRSMLRIGMFQIMRRCEDKAREKGGKVTYINPRYTSQTCSNCGCVEKTNRLTRDIYSCYECGYEGNADVNAARNIMTLGVAATAA
jgi:putative transposase